MSEAQKVRVLHRDVSLLAALIACAVGLFLFTRTVAAKVARMESRVAASWYQKGQGQLNSGAVESAIESFRKATANDRENRIYVLALADALEASNHKAEAERQLLRLRESDPENAEINLHLARLAAESGSVEDSVRYYHDALYGSLPGRRVDQRRREIRLELIRFLLAHHDQDRALSELLVLDADLPDTAASHIQIGHLFLNAGEARHALNDFDQAIRLDPKNPAALAGAGEAAFQLANYEKARHYLEDSIAQGQKSGQDLHLLSVVRMVFSNDPLAPHLTMQARQQRLLVALDQSVRRLDGCLGHLAGNAELEGLKTEAIAMRPKLSARKLLDDPQLVRSGLRLISRIEEATNAKCGEAAGIDEALLLIVRRHGDVQ